MNSGRQNAPNRRKFCCFVAIDAPIMLAVTIMTTR